MEIERKSFPAEFKVLDEAQGIIEIYAAIFNNVDGGDDVIRYGAFDKSVQRKKPKGVWMHDGSMTVAKTLETYPVTAGDARLPIEIAGLGGQFVKGQFNLDTQRGREGFSDIKFGIVDEFSIGYWPIEFEMLDGGVRELNELDWLEWSPVLAGMNPLTQLVSAKGKTIDDLSFTDDLDAVIDAVKRIGERTKARQALLTKQGRMLSGANIDKLQGICDGMTDHCSTLQDMIDSAAPLDDTGKSRRLKAIRKLLTKDSLTLTPQLQAIIQAIDDLVDMLLGEPEDEEPKGISPADLMTLRMNIARARVALVR